MLAEIGYDRKAAVKYALHWANSRNPFFYDFENIGGDCTNYVSQCLYAGCNAMNFSAENGWYYLNIDNRAPSWTGVDFLKSFLLTNNSEGIYGKAVTMREVKSGDVILLGDDSGNYYHSLIVSFAFPPTLPGDIFVCSHSYDRKNARLTEYNYHNALFIHIEGARKII